MNFISLEFAFLLILVLLLVCLVKQSNIRKLILLAASCLFYVWWDWRFLGLLGAVTVVDYAISRLLVGTSEPGRRKALLYASLAMNLGSLGFFKYFNFFLEPLYALAGVLGWEVGVLHIVLPIGISFYTFETLSYVIDVYHGAMQPARSLLDYAVFLTFFPSLVSGPIVRAKNFLPQLERGFPILPGNVAEGVQLILRGLLKKLVIADNVAVMADRIYVSPSMLSSPSVWLGVLAYSVQILCDFSGYTDMARGVGKILGFELPQNFNLPYTAQSITEFWQRWHISLSSWLRDYIFFPVRRALLKRGKRLPEWVAVCVPPMVTMLLCGLWHGASGQFLLWGALYGIYILFEQVAFGGKLTRPASTSMAAWGRALLVFGLVSLTWIPFRSPDWSTSVIILKKLLLLSSPYHFDWYYIWAILAVPVVVVGGLLARQFNWKWPIVPLQKNYLPAMILLEILLLFFFARIDSNPFIYFQF